VCAAVVTQVVSLLGSLDVLVNNAGGGQQEADPQDDTGGLAPPRRHAPRRVVLLYAGRGTGPLSRAEAASWVRLTQPNSLVALARPADSRQAGQGPVRDPARKLTAQGKTTIRRARQLATARPFAIPVTGPGWCLLPEE
jgi:NAD(P)-dependent dehydrogenase (short-subunit alcohol dehydrogenase family)